MELPQDRNDLLKLFAERDVEFLLVGGYAFGIHAYPRATGDLDHWLKIDPANAAKVMDALNAFGFGGVGLKAEDFLVPDQVIQLGVEPFRIDLMTSVEGVEWQEAEPNKLIIENNGLPLPVIGKNELIKNKLFTGRKKDQLDAQELQKQSKE